MTFSALIDGKNGKFWTPMYQGGVAAAKRAMQSNPKMIECSVYRGGRFVRSIKRVSA